jgi:hypothetical protein
VRRAVSGVLLSLTRVLLPAVSPIALSRRLVRVLPPPLLLLLALLVVVAAPLAVALVVVARPVRPAPIFVFSATRTRILRAVVRLGVEGAAIIVIVIIVAIIIVTAAVVIIIVIVVIVLVSTLVAAAAVPHWPRSAPGHLRIAGG